jgi:hypothetical protein
MNTSLRHLLWALRQWVRQPGWAGWLALALGLVCYGFAALIWQPQQQKLRQLSQAPPPVANPVARQPQTAKPDNASQLVQFYQSFPALEQLPDAMGQLYGLASSQNLVLEQGQYHLISDKHSHLLRYEIVLPVKGPYPQIRQFLKQAMQKLPGLALDGISLSRKKIDEPGVEAELHLSLYLREQ